MKIKTINIALKGICNGEVVGGLLLWTGENLQALFLFDLLDQGGKEQKEYWEKVKLEFKNNAHA